jgi:ectoine hydroxylase-related dioxygenase (phytanoyl-CoA dioxygenase family)
MTIAPNSNIPALNTDYSLDSTAVDSYRRDGHVLLRTVVSPAEIAVYRDLISSAAARFNTETRPVEERDTYGKAFLQIMNLWVKDESVRRFVLAHRFGKIAAQLMGVDAVRLYHDQALFKEAGGGPTPWHQDQYYWPLDTDHTITMWMPLIDASAQMGTMRFTSGSHCLGYLGALPISDESESAFEKFIGDRGYEVHAAGSMAAGDATFHSGWTLHGAPGNSSPHTREVMTIIYFADGARVSEPDNPNRKRDLATWLPGVEPGELAASELNPVIIRA